MPVVPLRDIGRVGVMTDIDPYDLPSGALSFGKNIRIENNRIERGSVFRSIADVAENPRHLIGFTNKLSNPQIVIMYHNGTLGQWDGSTEVSVTPSGFTPFEVDFQTTHCIVNNIVFLNRPDHAIWYRSKDGSGTFAPLPSGAGQFPSGTSCQAIASIKGVVVAMHLNKSGVSYPNNVLWSDFVPLDQPPVWDTSLATYAGSSAGENTLADMSSPIVGGLALKDRLMIYSQDETWYMEYVGGNDMFQFDRVFSKGMIQANCAVEVDGIHYVFGKDDIWAHDGVTSKSIAQGQVRQFIFNGMRKIDQTGFFVAHHPEQNEILFCYSSDDRYVRWYPNRGFGCNRAAIYNYASQAWYFADLPYITCSTAVSVRKNPTYNELPQTFDDMGGSFSAMQFEMKDQFITANWNNGSLGLPCKLRTFARYGAAVTAFPIDDVASSSALIYREGLDLDELNAELRGYKLCSSLWPQIRIDNDAMPLVFTIGSCDHPNASPIWGNTQTYDNNWNRLDHNIAGRFLAYKIEQSDIKNFSMTGYDFDLTLLGKR